MRTRIARVAIAAVIVGCLGVSARAADEVSMDEVRAIAKEAYIYGNPMVDNYRIGFAYFVDAKNPEFKAPWNEIRNMARVFTPEDKAIQTPNSDTPYSMLGLDLRAEPLVLSVPPMEKERYYSLQFIDAYTFNFDYCGSRTTGNGEGHFLVAGPSWKGKTPKGITKVIRSETELIMVTYRTQLFNPSDLDNVKKIQAAYTVQPLSEYLGKRAPKPAPAIDWIQPLTPADQKTSLEFFNILNFVLQFCPTAESEKDLMKRFAEIGVGAGKHIDVANLSPEMKQAMSDGIADAWKELKDLQENGIATGKVTSGDLFGTRDYLKNNYLYRFAAAVLGIYGNSKQEATYPIYQLDDTGKSLDGAQNRYAIRFAPGQLPPVNAFWSLTMYALPESMLVANPINRYLVNSPMLPDLKLDADGGLTIYIQKDSPGADKESNWLPAPNGPFMVVLRIYWPKEEALNGTWKQPPLTLVK